MAVELITDQAPERPAALTARGRAVARLLAFEDVWSELDGADRTYFATEFEQFAREAREAGEGRVAL